MDDLISRSALIKIITEWPKHLGIIDPSAEVLYAERIGNFEALAAIRGEVDRLPAVDAVPVVRCGECKWYDSAFFVCSKCGVCVNRDFFCADGARMDAEEDKC